MSYDIFIPPINVAIEYQGKQHYESIEFFGGVEAFEQRQFLDTLKTKLSIENSMHLVYIKYDEELNKELIRQRIREVLPNIVR